MNRERADVKTSTGRFAYDGLERVIHEKARLGVLSSLAAHPDGLLFTELKTLCSLTDGNLSRQIQLLQETGFVETWKGFRNKRPQTLCRLTDTGRERFLEYIAVLESVVTDAHANQKKRAMHPDSLLIRNPSNVNEAENYEAIRIILKLYTVKLFI